jgi:colanic acid/amylovoran biosynthesis glycosyltransferase
MRQPSIRPADGLRVAYLTGVYPRATDTFIQREVASLREAGVDVHTFAVREPAADQLIGPVQVAEAASTTYLLPASVGGIVLALAAALRHPRRFVGAAALSQRTHPRGVRGALTQCAYFVEAAVLARHLRQRSIQHVHNHFPDSSGTVVMLAAHLAGVQFSFTLHGAEILRDVAKWRLDEKVARAAFGVSVSWYGRAQAMLVSPPSAWGRLHVVRCGIDATQYTPTHHGGQRSSVLFVGRLDPVKGLPVLLDAFAQVLRDRPSAVLTLVGDGPGREAAEQQVKALAIDHAVHFAGYCTAAEVADHLAAADVFVLPSFFEGIPVSLMEAMAAQVPVVASQLPGIAELVEHGEHGYLVPAGHTEQLAERITALLSQPALRQRMGEAGRAKVLAEFDEASAAAQLHDLFLAAAQEVTDGR